MQQRFLLMFLTIAGFCQGGKILSQVKGLQRNEEARRMEDLNSSPTTPALGTFFSGKKSYTHKTQQGGTGSLSSKFGQVPGVQNTVTVQAPVQPKAPSSVLSPTETKTGTDVPTTAAPSVVKQLTTPSVLSTVATAPAAAAAPAVLSPAAVGTVRVSPSAAATPAAVTPTAVTPAAITPAAVSPAAITPAAITPAAAANPAAPVVWTAGSPAVGNPAATSATVTTVSPFGYNAGTNAPIGHNAGTSAPVGYDVGTSSPVPSVLFPLRTTSPILELPTPPLPPSPGFPVCQVCGPGKLVTEQDAVVTFPGQSPTTCAAMEKGGQEGFVDPQYCPILPVFLSECKCSGPEAGSISRNEDGQSFGSASDTPVATGRTVAPVVATWPASKEPSESLTPAKGFAFATGTPSAAPTVHPSSIVSTYGPTNMQVSASLRPSVKPTTEQSVAYPSSTPSFEGTQAPSFKEAPSAESPVGQGQVKNNPGLEPPEKRENDEDELEKEVLEEEKELQNVETEAKTAGGLGVALALLGMVFTAHQMSENPDGIYASVCRLCITMIGCVLKVFLLPCRNLFGTRYPSGHMPVSTLEYREPYRGDMELT